MNDDLFICNGIDAETGEYLQPPLSADQICALARGIEPDEPHRNELKNLHDKKAPHYGLVAGIDPKDLAQTGWGVIFAHDADPAIREALKPLLELRRGQASSGKEPLYREYWKDTGYQPNQTKPAFLKENGTGAGLVEPKKMPYYLLLVGDPEVIPYSFQYQMDVQFAVGRIHFENVEDYARYARSVVDAETNGCALPPRASFWGTRHTGDRSTELSSEHLITPLAQFTATQQKEKKQWTVDTSVAGAATKARLATLLGGAETPSLLFTACHGMSFCGHSRQFERSGALTCQDWQGGKASRDHYFCAEDLGPDASLHGLIAMFFACYGAGTPKFNEFAIYDKATERSLIAPKPFVSRLPMRMLCHPKGGALAVVGHVERAFGCSFLNQRSEQQLETFQNTLQCLFEGHPIGSALESFNSRYAELSSDLTTLLEPLSFPMYKPTDEEKQEIASLWTLNNDSRNYAIVGDPAVRLPSSGTAPPPPPQRETIVVSRPAPAPAPQSLPDLEVYTYTSGNMTSVKFEAGAMEGADLHAMTRVGADGKVHVCVPGNANEAVWKMHLDALEKAMAHRAELWKLTLAARKDG